MPKKSKSLCVDDLRHAEYYDMQTTFDTLYQKSMDGEKFEHLMELILSRDNILLAYRNIKANKGSYTAGTDNQNITVIGRMTPDKVVKKVRFIVTESQHGYRPKPVRRKDIPKQNGKTRPLGIPCIWDRLVQQCVKQILEPICEAKFYNNSYGFRPNRSVEHAISKTYKVAMPKRIKVCSYTAEGREPIHTELSLNKAVLYGLRTKKPQEDSIEVLDSSLSLFSAQKGKCAISGEEFTTAQSIACWYKKPKEQGGLERYKNMTLIHDRYLPLLQKTSLEQLKALAKTLKVTTKMMSKINSLRKLSGLPTIG